MKHLHSDDEDPMVRGLALRSLCNLRLITILEYVEAPLQKCLGDGSAYVRKTAVMGVLKVTVDSWCSGMQDLVLPLQSSYLSYIFTCLISTICALLI